MSPRSTRDDFSESTKRAAACRVAYRCSFPHCPNITVGPSFENASKPATTGVASHICAAAPGGPRYDSNMTAEERKSISNCIWLCQTHAHLIDTDVNTYPADLLREWKKTAELATGKALADASFWDEYYKNNQNNLNQIQNLIDESIESGQYKTISTILAQYQVGQLSEVYDEFVLRNRIVYNVWKCDKEISS